MHFRFGRRDGRVPRFLALFQLFTKRPFRRPSLNGNNLGEPHFSSVPFILCSHRLPAAISRGGSGAEHRTSYGKAIENHTH